MINDIATLEDAIAYGIQLVEELDHKQWQLGDLGNYVTAENYKAKDYAAAINIDPARLSQYMTVARVIPYHLRHLDGLSWSHYRTLAYSPHAGDEIQMLAWLDMCQTENWTAAQFALELGTTTSTPDTSDTPNRILWENLTVSPHDVRHSLPDALNRAHIENRLVVRVGSDGTMVIRIKPSLPGKLDTAANF